MENLPQIARTEFLQSLSLAVQQARGEDDNLGLLLIDLANLARINHCHGYVTGDMILSSAYEGLLGISKLPDSVYRVGDHRFAFILSGLTNPAFSALAMNKVQRVLEEELYIDTDMVEVELRIGIAINLLGGRDSMSMLALAEESLAHVKRGGSHRAEDFLGEDIGETRDFHLEQLFADALHDNDFELYYQPKLNLASGRVDSVEALLRWEPEGRGAVSPATVLELSESAGKDYELTKWVAHRALRQLKKWQQDMDLSLSFNVQAGLVSNPELAAMLEDAIAIWGVDPAKVTLEITESGIIEDKESGFGNLLEMRRQGVKLSIDDFGTGYSSLSYFKQIPADELKIDQSFIRTMMNDTDDLELIKVIIQIAKLFGLTVVAEGVEDRGSLDMLRELGVDYVQGFLLSKALPAEELEAWLNAWEGLPAAREPGAAEVMANE